MTCQHSPGPIFQAKGLYLMIGCVRCKMIYYMPRKEHPDLKYERDGLCNGIRHSNGKRCRNAVKSPALFCDFHVDQF